ncbi:transposase [Escherichia coli]|uniref:transposase n=1 Tax=Escherichia coli TaxID=562 RepID=UPI003EBC9037
MRIKLNGNCISGPDRGNTYGICFSLNNFPQQRRHDCSATQYDETADRIRTLKQHPRKNKTAINIEYMKASIRAKVEHPFRIIKRQFGFVKARYKGLLKNDNQLAMLFTLANLFRADQMIRQWERSH